MLLDSWSSQAVTPRDEHSVDYYMSWGARADQEFPGLSQLMIDVVFEAFNEDRVILEAQQLRVQIKSLFLGPATRAATSNVLTGCLYFCPSPIYKWECNNGCSRY